MGIAPAVAIDRKFEVDSRHSFLRFRICPVLTGWKGLWNTGWMPNASTPETCA
jgi:hypothetical protein